MLRRTIGKSGISATAITMGLWAAGGDNAWGPSDDTETTRAIRAALDKGIDTFDTAPAYGFGRSERVLGEALKDVRSRVNIITKCGLRFDGIGSLLMERDGRRVAIDLSPQAIIDGVDRSLQNLQTDHIDILITHWQSRPPHVVPIADTMGTLLDLKKAGKILGIGISNVTLEQVKEYLKYGQVDLIQQKYSMLTRDAEAELLPFCIENNITLQAYSPLEQGLLTGHVTMDTAVIEGSVRSRNRWYQQPELRAKLIGMLESWQPLCEKYDCNISNLAIAWLLGQGEVVNAACGARKAEHILENARGGDIVLDSADIAKMRQDILSIEE